MKEVIMNNELPLHKTTHWRRLRGILNSLSSLEGVDLSTYNPEKIVCYRTIGSEMQGKNVKFHNTASRSCWVMDNHYDFYEIPKTGNEKNIEGKFLFLAHNTDFDYWIFGQMEYRINKFSSSFSDNAEFLPYGTYDVTIDGNKHLIQKKRLGRNTDYGFKNPNGIFDALGARKKAYNTSASKLLGKSAGIKQNMHSLKGGDAVKVYKNKKKKNNKKY